MGIQYTYYWNVFENSSLGVYNFSVLDTDYVNITGYVSGSGSSAIYNSPRRLGIYILDSDFFNSNPTSILPTYITSNPGTYGAGFDGVHGGYWVTNGSGGAGTAACGALWRSSVMTRVIALLTALGSHVLPDGNTVDASPYVEAVWFPEQTSEQPDSGTDPTFSLANYNTQMLALGAGAATALPHTQFSIANNFGGSQSNTQTINANLVTNRTAASGPDVFTSASGGFTWGQFAWQGYGWNGSSWVAGTGTNLIGQIPYLAQVQATELGDVVSQLPSDTFNVADASLQASQIWWTVVQGNSTGYVPGNWYGSQWASPGSWNASTSGGVLATIVNSSLTNTARPSSYP